MTLPANKKHIEPYLRSTWVALTHSQMAKLEAMSIKYGLTKQDMFRKLIEEYKDD